jgi:hypothetical protein
MQHQCYVWHTATRLSNHLVPNISKDIGSGFCSMAAESNPDNVRGNMISCGRRLRPNEARLQHLFLFHCAFLLCHKTDWNRVSFQLASNSTLQSHRPRTFVWAP